MADSLFDVLRQKRQFIPDGFRDEDGVWHDGPHRIEFDAAVDLAERLYEALFSIGDRETEGIELSNGWDAFREVVLEAREAIGVE